MDRQMQGPAHRGAGKKAEPQRTLLSSSSTSKIFPPLQPQSICSTLEQDDCSKTIAIYFLIPNAYLITIQLQTAV